MKRGLLDLILFCALAVVAYPARAADAVEPASCSVTNFRGEAVTSLSAESFYMGATLLLTNCTLYAGTGTNSAKQGLDEVSIELKLGDTTLATTYTGTVAGATSNGSWWAALVVPTNSPGSPVWLQIKITDANTNSYIYPWRSLSRATAL